MVVKKVNYSRDFLSKTNNENPHCNKITQETAEEDDAIRDEIRNKFDSSSGSGFDGEQRHNYIVFGKPNVPINTLENVKYKTTYYITKSGALEKISKAC